MNEKPILQLDGIAFAYSGRPPLFEKLDFCLCVGDHLGLHGPNGSGKTTFLRLLMGLEKMQQGRLLFHGQEVDKAEKMREMRCSVGFVLQNSDEQLFSPTVIEDVAFGPLNMGMKRQEARKRAMDTLETLGLTALAGRAAHQLSGGEKKMVAIASVLSMRPEALLLDEPTAFLDDSAREKITALLQKQDIATLIVSHDWDFLQKTTTAVVHICQGRLTEGQQIQS